MYCKNCGNLLKSDARFCNGCGQPVVNQPTNFTSQANPQSYGTPYVAPHHYGGYMAPPKRNTGKIIAISLVVVLLAFASLYFFTDIFDNSSEKSSSSGSTISLGKKDDPKPVSSLDVSKVGVSPDGAVLDVFRGVFEEDTDFLIEVFGGLAAFREYAEFYWYEYGEGLTIEEYYEVEYDYLKTEIAAFNEFLTESFGKDWITRIKTRVESESGDYAVISIILDDEVDDYIDVYRRNGRWIVDIFDFF